MPNGYDVRLEIRISSARTKIAKCLFGQEKIQFLGHVIDKKGIAADPSMQGYNNCRPENISKLRHFLGMATN